ncbi:glycoside hydrolase family 99-like domain-containing protein [Desemzia sp. FAM 24101]|uniref:glycosyltransferase WbsX family protein n=1 Tax=Desemzia sp. FAM 24101 TaxID=3259522 RepID=UPI00388A09D3
MNERMIALYLPQYHPIKENDIWYGKGFTEWTNVAKAKPLFKGHYQPHIPADLGFYDLRLRETRKAQADMAKEYGIEAFCYWHYWFGNGVELLESPFKEVVKDKSIDFPFCLAWANHTWQKKMWDNQEENQVIMEQTYRGEEDYIAHFESLLPAFKDERYVRVDGKLFFIIYDPFDSEEIPKMMKIWNQLAQENGLNGFYFIGKTFYNERKDEILSLGFDSVYNETMLTIHHNLSLFNKGKLLFQRNILKMPTVFPYKEASKYQVTADDYQENTIPVIVPNWDHSPRSGSNGMIFTDSHPRYFKKVVKEAINSVKDKPDDKKIIIIKSWNEWGEGNHLEPDLKYGTGYLEAIKETIKESDE